MISLTVIACRVVVHGIEERMTRLLPASVVTQPGSARCCRVERSSPFHRHRVVAIQFRRHVPVLLLRTLVTRGRILLVGQVRG